MKMKCCAPSCKNDSRRITKSQGITFHIFPFDSSLRKAWLKALGKETWEPKAHNAVCSEHFLWDDLYVTKSGLRKVRAGAVPLIVQEGCDIEKPATLRACRICLVMDARLYSIRQYKLEQAFENLSGISLSEEDKLPQKLCVECVQRLLNSSRLRHKCLQANSLMLEVVQKDNNLTNKNIKKINRITNQLVSSLSFKHFEVNHFDTFINEEPPIEIEDKCPIKEENEIFLTDDITDKNDGFNDNGFNDPGFNDPGINEPGINEPGFNEPGINESEITDVLENDDDSDKEYTILSDKDLNYSSDDSLPLEKCKTKKSKKRKERVDKPGQHVKRVKKTEIPAEPKIDRRRKPFLNDDLNETLFTITNLTYEEQIAEIEKRQESSNYKNAIFKCTACFKGFLDEDAYNSHMSRHTDQCGEHECGICKTHFKHPHALRKHITAHHTQRFSCKQCPYVTTHRQTARLHERWHKGTRYTCPHCQDQFVKFTTYMGHIRIKHPSDFVCELCGYSFVSAKGIELHKKLKHRLDNKQIPEDGPLCELCNVRFVSSVAHKRHLSVSARHNSAGTIKESNKPKRGRKTGESKELERLAREKGKDTDDEKRRYPSQMRKAEGPIPCEQCGMQLEDSRAYHGHFRRMHPDKNRTKYPSMKSPCMCEVCGRMFQSYALLKDHTWVHTGERPFKCESCGKSFRMKQRLVTHMKVHSQVRVSYGCTVCGKHFSTHSNRQRHMFIHTGLKPFKCEMCGKGFKHSSEKRAHITYVHLKKPWPKRARGKRRSEPRQGSLPPQDQNIEMEAPMWPPCDPKLGEIGPMMENKPVYYNLKI